MRQESPSISSNGYDFEGSNNGSYQYRREEDLYVLLDNANSDVTLICYPNLSNCEIGLGCKS